MRPVVDGLGEDYGDRVRFLALDANGEGNQAFRAGSLPGHPAFVVMLPDGHEVWRGFGLVDQADLEAAILSALEQLRTGG